jgi:hypothetical protein
MPRKKRPEGTRAPNGASSIYYSEYDQKWHGRVTMGVLDNGKPDRRHVKSADESTVIDKVRELENARAEGRTPPKGNGGTVAQWLTQWVEEIAPINSRFKTIESHRTNVYKHLVPNVGAHQLKRIEPEHFERLYSRMQKAGLSASTAHSVHRTARNAFNEAMRRGRLTRNVVTLAKSPRIDEEEIEPLTPDEVQRVIQAALQRRNGGL